MVQSIILGGIALGIIYFVFSTIKNDGVYTPSEIEIETQSQPTPSNTEEDIEWDADTVVGLVKLIVGAVLLIVGLISILN